MKPVAPTTTEVSPRQLHDALATGAPRFLLLDVRNAEEFAAWPIEGRVAPDVLHVPYFDFLEDEDASVAKVEAYRDRPIAVVCAKGGSSDYVAGLLRERGFNAANLAGGMIAWGELLVPVDVPTAGSLVIKQIKRVGKGCVSYLIGNAGRAIVVDPFRHPAAYAELAKSLGFEIAFVFDTHLHADHISGGRELADLTGARYLLDVHDGEGAKFAFDPIRPGETIQLGTTNVELMPLYTPGHTPGSASMLIDGQYLVSGDTLFVASIGRPDLGGQMEAWGRMLFHTLNDAVAKLPDDVLILPAHYAGPDEERPDGVVAGTLGELRRTNAALSLRTEDDFIAFLQANQTAAPETYREIRRVNLAWAAIDETRATELELGKNECAASRGHQH